MTQSNNLISGIIIDESHYLTLEEFCQATKANKEIIMVMVEYQLVQPIGLKPEEWRFDSVSLRRGRIAASFYHDLEINMPGVALALELLDKIEYLQQQVNSLQKITEE